MGHKTHTLTSPFSIRFTNLTTAGAIKCLSSNEIIFISVISLLFINL